MASTVNEQLKVRDLVPAIATVASACGWSVVNLHANRANPGQTSLPDLMLTKEGQPPLMVKALTGRAELSAGQNAWFKHFKACGFRCLTFHPEDIAEVFEVLNSATVAE